MDEPRPPDPRRRLPGAARTVDGGSPIGDRRGHLTSRLAVEEQPTRGLTGRTQECGHGRRCG